jgi:transglutaminase-like putative cysteine protease
MKKIFFLSLVFLLLSVHPSFAKDNNFDVSVNADYSVSDNGTTSITQNIQIKNKTEYFYTPTYTVSVGFKDIENITAYNSSGSIPFTQTDNPNGTKSIKLTFPNRITGLGKTNTFTLKFDTTDIAKKEGNIWEISIPGISDLDNFASYDTAITAPQSFGKASIIKPQNKTANGNTVFFSKDEIGNAGIVLMYGQKQYFAFNLTYNISNPNLFPVQTEIALPPQTNYQNIEISDITPRPLNVTLDSDGNWIAKYSLFPSQKKTITVKGVAEILAQPSKSTLTSDEKKEYTSPQKYWESEDPKIQNAAKKLKTPKDIYDFVVKTLSYDYAKISTDNKRLGAKGALLTPTDSVCLEFTDLFVALARSKGIPARSVEGFAYTQNDKLRPVSLNSDILHAWPEYYDESAQKWVMVDPTWGNTTKGMDYFSSLDFEHIAFAIEGYDSQYPIPAGGYKFDSKSKDVDVSFSSPQDFKSVNNLKISDTFPSFTFPGLTVAGSFVVKNNGSIPVSNLTATVKANSSNPQSFSIDYIPPFGQKEISLKYDKVPFLTKGVYTLTMQVGNIKTTKNIHISFVPDLRWLFILGGIIGGSIIVSSATYYTGSLLIQRRKRQNNLRGKGKKP